MTTNRKNSRIAFDIILAEGKPLMKLPADFKKQWLDALRSGKYQQTDGYLHIDDGFCCLGVACDIQHSSAPTWKERDTRESELAGYVSIFETSNGAINMPLREDLPDDIYDVLRQPTDFADQYPEIDCDSDIVIFDGDNVPSVMAAFAGLNDAGYSFDEIADWIEANL